MKRNGEIENGYLMTWTKYGVSLDRIYCIYCTIMYCEYNVYTIMYCEYNVYTIMYSEYNVYTIMYSEYNVYSIMYSDLYLCSMNNFC